MNDPAIGFMLGLLIGGAGMGMVWCLYHVSKMAEARAAQSRLSDAHNATKERIERALDCVTPSSAHVGKKMAAILTGERLGAQHESPVSNGDAPCHRHPDCDCIVGCAAKQGGIA